MGNSEDISFTEDKSSIEISKKTEEPATRIYVYRRGNKEWLIEKSELEEKAGETEVICSQIAPIIRFILNGRK